MTNMKEKDPNEVFSCCHCGKEVFGRYLWCSQECENLHMRKMEDKYFTEVVK